ncbi:blr8080 [Bradyrhizobium diazoefficiens USDA 110]|uniref:Blr8080 protein n=1 Tax=Bradyrhizobium diazoefficiens (strain JCM 10833 / BCRC 13528 / IAM 13628 / NBRC 14792 / USDA 110) TaxID=224911 RepID=Q89BR8_BRADU|nr:hypothetical protein [Bradyrhizobium diazoefficiens]AND92924.1 hypothetical protein AAV28_38085 [Bradyrhizobium diazoefficiens USDA 110]QBP26807.1 hypothetical protein Bdiaspc4_42775 [Bradyrhizobium diazoefficiens]BAC53345.1 blr8080 [Bradyrhizobium diazoefficiens USDA 110]BCF48119.1 hypothetical protein XF16B_86090 [Bradyrhizobium diazoefficiens]BCF74280.1 hypothetical protein XF19B_86330 [Bradyrhizobium diazoefficiens]
MATKTEVYAAADAEAEVRGSAKKVTVTAVCRRCGGRPHEIEPLLAGWRAERAQRGGDRPHPAPAPAPIGDFLIGRAERKRTGGNDRNRGPGEAPDPDPPAPVGSGMPLASAESDFLAGRRMRRARMAERVPVNVLPPGMPTAKQRKAKPRKPPKPAYVRKRPPKPTAEEKRERDARITTHVLRAREERLNRLVKPSDYRDAIDPPVAKAVALELRRAGRPLMPKRLIDTGRVPFATNRPYRDLPVALAGSRIFQTESGSCWFDYEPAPTKRIAVKPPDTITIFRREFADFLWERALATLRNGPMRRAAISAALQPEITYLNPDWLPQRLKREAKAKTIVARPGGWALRG